MRSLRVVTLVSLAVLVTSTSACQLLAADEGSASEIVIAADLEMSGATAAVGTAYRRALELKVDQINRRGVLGGRKIKLVISDNRSDHSLAVNNIAGYANNADVAAIITGACGECLLAAQNIVNERKIPTIALAPAHAVVNPVTERRYIFKVAPNPNDGASTLVGELDRAGIKKVGILSAQDEYGKDGRTALDGELTKAGIAKAGEAQIKPTDTDLGQAVEDVLAKGPEALVIWTYPAQASAAAVAARKGGFRGRLFFDTAAAGDLFVDATAKDATENAVMIAMQTMAIDDVIANTPAKAARKQWFRDYTSRYGAYYGYASYAADALQLLVSAIETAGNTNRDRVRDVLETSNMDGLSGPIRITPDNHSGLAPQALTVLVNRNGRWRLLS